MDAYLYLVLFAEFLEENTTPILIVLAEFIMFVGFLFGWFVGHLRNNKVLADMETALLKMENENRELKDYEAFYRHHIASALGSPMPVWTHRCATMCWMPTSARVFALGIAY